MEDYAKITPELRARILRARPDAPVMGFEFRVIDQTGWYRGLIARPSGITFFIFKPMKLILFKSNRVVPRPKVVLVRTTFLFPQKKEACYEYFYSHHCPLHRIFCQRFYFSFYGDSLPKSDSYPISTMPTEVCTSVFLGVALRFPVRTSNTNFLSID